MTPMDFPHEQYQYHVASQQQPQQHQHQHQHHANQPSLSYGHYPVQPQHVEAYYPAPQHAEYADFGSMTPDHEDFEGCTEILTRPRLTKEQVEVLEAQFQAHPKPNSNVKRQLALQTKLTLPRVANWFQNRRAKAKQMKKQEEFEMTQGMGIGEAWNNDHHIPTGYTIPLQINTAAATSRSLPPVSAGGMSHSSATPSSAEVFPGRDAVQEASWASLQRALSAADDARSQHKQNPGQCFTSLSYRDPQQPVSSSFSHEQSHFQLHPSSEWSRTAPLSGPWNPSSQSSEESEFDFGFNSQSSENHTIHDVGQPRFDSPDAIQAYSMSSDVWTSSMPTPTIDSHVPPSSMALHESDPLPMPRFPSSRRGSSSDDLTATLDQFVLAGTPPMRSPVTNQFEQFKKPGTHVDIAARRKRPRPAALGTAALRSYSYGGSSAMSPTFRFGRQSQNAHPIRHVKSTGQNLNVTYGGIRKSGSAQRSPLNISTFAEAEEFNNLVEKQKYSQRSDLEQSRAPPTPLSNEDLMRTRLPTLEEPLFTEQDQETPQQYFLNGQPSQFSIASPPSTPMKSELFPPPHMQSMMPPMSAPPQYAVFPEYTPPYSAGPLTASSWSDAPLTSPEMAKFSPSAHMSQQTYVSPVMHDYSSGHPYPGPFATQRHAEQKQIENLAPAPNGQKQTEFFIQEFPRQKEEHARAAQQMAQQRPKNYVFANATPSDF